MAQGQKHKPTPASRVTVKVMFEAGATWDEVARAIGVSKTTARRYYAGERRARKPVVPISPTDPPAVRHALTVLADVVDAVEDDERRQPAVYIRVSEQHLTEEERDAIAVLVSAGLITLVDPDPVAGATEESAVIRRINESAAAGNEDDEAWLRDHPRFRRH